MTNTWEEVIQQFHSGSHRAVLAITGGGTTAISQLLSVPGASKTILEAIVPYALVSLADWLGRRSEQACSEKTALKMAATSLQRAQLLTATESTDIGNAHNLQNVAPDLIGLGCTASIRSHTLKQGDHRCFVATETALTTCLYSIVLTKGFRDRTGEEQIVSELVLRAVAETCDIPAIPQLDVTDDETVYVDRLQADPLLADVRSGRLMNVWSLPNGCLAINSHVVPQGILSGSFDPLHAGHIALRTAAEKYLGTPVFYELPIFNADKPPLDYLTIEARRAQFREEQLALTAAPTFAQKAIIFPDTTFVVGIDTAERIVQPQFYGGSEDSMRTALSQFRRQGCKILVAGRKSGISFRTLADINVPKDFTELFVELPESQFRSDISSTEHRKRN